MRNEAVIVFILVILHCWSGSALILKASDGKTRFLAIGRPSAIKVSGEGSGPEGELKFTKEGSDCFLTGRTSVSLTSFQTGIATRDQHMKEKYLEVDKFKEAILIFEKARMSLGALNGGEAVKVLAHLDLHGIIKPIEILMTFEKKEAQVLSSSSFKIKLSDYSIAIPKFAGITVADEVEVHTEAHFDKKALDGIL